MAIEGWRVALLLVGFVIVTLCFEKCIELVEKRLKKRKGLLTAFRALKNELLYLGFLSLLLSVTQVIMTVLLWWAEFAEGYQSWRVWRPIVLVQPRFECCAHRNSLYCIRMRFCVSLCPVGAVLSG